MQGSPAGERGAPANMTTYFPLPEKEGARGWLALIRFYRIKLSRVLAYLNYKVLFGRVAADKLVFYENERFELRYLLELRAFDKNKELRLKRRDDKFFWRRRIDEAGVSGEAVEAEQVLWGKLRDIKKEGWQRLEEERGFSLIVPYSGGEAGQRLEIKTRNYIGYNELGQAGYVDSRFVGWGRCGNGKGKSYIDKN